MRKAQVYYEKSLQELEQFKLECFLSVVEFIIILLNSTRK